MIVIAPHEKSLFQLGTYHMSGCGCKVLGLGAVSCETVIVLILYFNVQLFDD